MVTSHIGDTAPRPKTSKKRRSDMPFGLSKFFTKLHIRKGGMTYFECTKCDYGYFGSQDGTT